MKDLLDYGTAIGRLRERKGLSREDLARGSGVSYSYLSEVERGLKRPSTDVLARLATALEMLPSELLRQIEEMSAKGRGLFRKRVLEAPMHEHPGDVSETAIRNLWSTVPTEESLRNVLEEAQTVPPSRYVKALVDELSQTASTLSPEDLRMLIALARRLLEGGKNRP